MNSNFTPKQQTINPYVIKTTFIVNTMLLCCHLFFCILFYVNNATLLFGFNIFSITVYILSYFILLKQKANLYICVVYLEIYAFTTINVLCLGWDYGFQLYFISTVIASFFTDFYVNQKYKLKKLTMLFIAINICTFIFLRIWTYRRTPMYSIADDLFVHGFFISNALITFTFMLSYCYIYSGTVYRLEKALVNMANKDSLTGLHNRRNMQDMLNSVSEDRLVSTANICVAMIDIDNFKQINDTYGHDIGDQVLKSFADILIELRDSIPDFNVCRWGGEEFLVFYQNYDKTEQEVLKIFDTIREKAAKECISYENTEINYTITTGLTFHRSKVSIKNMIKQADDNLYKGKQNTKNVVINS